jgi:hypothetical protein
MGLFNRKKKDVEKKNIVYDYSDGYYLYDRPADLNEILRKEAESDRMIDESYAKWTIENFDRNKDGTHLDFFMRSMVRRMGCKVGHLDMSGDWGAAMFVSLHGKSIVVRSDTMDPNDPFSIDPVGRISKAKEHYKADEGWAFLFIRAPDDMKEKAIEKGVTIIDRDAVAELITLMNRPPEELYGEGCACYAGKNERRAAELFLLAAVRGHTGAQAEIGACYMSGAGVEKDQKKGVEWYTKAAEQGHADAQYLLGGCYREGRGVQQDHKKAAKWYKKAADQGHTDAKESISLMKRDKKI